MVQYFYGADQCSTPKISSIGVEESDLGEWFSVTSQLSRAA
jgi:hypothetical protein